MLIRNDSGNITGRGVSSQQLTAQDHSGDITVVFTKVPDLVRISNSSGNITLVFPPGPTAYRVSASTSSGQTSVNVPQSPHVTARGLGDRPVGRHHHRPVSSRSCPAAGPGHTLAKASSRIDRPSSSRSSPITSGGRNRSTLPNVPQVRVTSPCGVAGLGHLAGGGRVRLQAARLGELDREHRAAPRTSAMIG